MPHPTRKEWLFACLKGTLSSYLRPARFSRVSLQQLDGLKRRIQASCGVREEEIKEAIASWIDARLYSDPEKLKELRRKYWPEAEQVCLEGRDLLPGSGRGNTSANSIRAKLQASQPKKACEPFPRTPPPKHIGFN